MRRGLWIAGLLILAGVVHGQTVTGIQTVPPGITATNQPSIQVAFTLTGFTTPVQVTFQRDDLATDTVSGLSNGSNQITLVLSDLGTVERRVSWNVVAQGASGTPVTLFNAISVYYDTVAPAPPTITSPTFPATVYTDTMVVRGTVTSSAGSVPVTAGTVYIRLNDAPNAGVLIGAGAILANPAGSFTATAVLSTITTGVATRLSITAEDQVGNLSSPVVVTITRQTAPAPTFTSGPTCQPGGLLTNNPAVLVRGAVTGNVPPFVVYFFVDGFLESSIQLLQPSNEFAHTISLPSQGQHYIRVQAANSNQPPEYTRSILACSIALDTVSPGPPNILQPNPTFATFLTTSSSFVIQGISSERAFCTTSPACPRPRIELRGPSGVTFAPASPLTPSDSTNQFQTTVGLPTTLRDGQYTIYVTSVDAAGNTSSGASAQVIFDLDRTPPTVDQVRVNGTQVPQVNPEVYVGRSTVDVQVRTSEEMATPPQVRFTQAGGSTSPLGLTSYTARVFNYGFTAVPNQDGPVSATITGGRDLAGNPINAALSRLFIVDTTAPQVTSVEPGDTTTLINHTPERIRIVMRDPPDGTGLRSGVDTVATQVTLEGPIGTGTPVQYPGTMVPFDPQTVDFLPTGTLGADGTYRIRIVARDKVGNFSAEIVRTFVLDTTPIANRAGLIQFLPPCGTFVNPRTFPGGAATAPFVQATVNDPQFSATRSDIELDDFCRAPPKIPGTKSVVSSSTIRYTLSKPLATDGSEDGTYTIALTMRDQAGNTSPTTFCTFVYDSLPPLVDKTFPANGQCINGPLRHVDATLVDPVPDTCRSRSGIDRGSSRLRLFLQSPNTYFNKNQPAELRGVLRFVSVGTIDRVLLEIVDSTNVPVGLRTDGGDDGVYRLEVQATDKAGNQSPVTSTTFTYDTLAPDLVVDRLDDGATLTGPIVGISGSTRDNAGGTDIDRVVASLVSVDKNGVPTTSVPTFANVTATISPLAVPSSGNPPRRTFTFNIPLTSSSSLFRARLTLTSYDKAGNYRDQGYFVWVQPTRLVSPILSQPQSGACTQSSYIDFSWLPVDGATDYQIRIRTPKGNEIVKATNGPETHIRVNLGTSSDGDGQYLWSVAGVDAGNQVGGWALNSVLKVDTAPPRVIGVDVQDPSPNSHGLLTAGESRVVITFNESLNTAAGLSVKLVPENKSVAPLVVTTISFQENVWTGKLVIPASTASKPDYNGIGEFEIQGGRDCAANLMALPDHGLLVYEVNSGPYLRAAVFQNPVDHRDLIVLLKGYKKSNGLAARIIDLPVATFTRQGDADQSPVLNRINESTFQGLYRFSMANASPIILHATARDELGNTSTYDITLEVVQVSPTEATVVQPTSATKLTVAASSVASKAGIVAIQRARSILAEKGLFARTDGQKLVAVAALDHFGPIGFKFDKPATLEVDLDKLGTVERPDLMAKAGLYEKVGDRWNWVPQTRAGKVLKASIGTLYPLALLHDGDAPAISVTKPGPDGLVDANNPTLEVDLSDAGSGIDPASAKVTIDDQPLESTFDSAAGHLTARLPVDRTGERQASIKVTDRAGNVTQSSARLVVPAGFGLSELVPFPNPARLVSRLRYRLKGWTDQVDITIHNVAGRTVRRLEGTTAVGSNTVDWPLDDDDGSPIANGVYLVRVVVTGQGQRAVGRTKIAVIR